MMLLDTCALIWLAEGSDRISPETLRTIDEVPVVHIAAITGFEISLKYKQRKLELPALPSEWLTTILNHHGISVIPLSLDLCVAAAELPPVHADPCDRFIIATARRERLPIVTADPRFEQYDVEVVI